MLLRYNRFLQFLLMFLIGGFAYGGLEIFFRGYSHISMMIAGGICFILIGSINEVYSGEISLLMQMAIAAVLVTLVELVTGLIVNIWLGLKVWDYSDLKLNFMGQICALYTLIWFFYLR